jgi:hypothetical protein
MEHDGSLPCSQQPATGPCPESDKSSPRPHILFFKIDLDISPIPTRPAPGHLGLYFVHGFHILR